MESKKILTALGIGYMCTQLSNVKKINIKADELGKIEEKKSEIAIFLIDENSCENIFILNMNKKNKKINIINIDVNTYLEDYKINNYYVNNGVIDTIKLLNNKLDFNISNCIKLDYSIIKDIVFKLNGLEIKVAKSQVKYIRNLTLNENDTYILNEDQIIDYIKIQDSNGDDLKNKIKVIKIISNKLLSLDNNRFLKILSEIMPSIETTLNTKQLIYLGLDLIKIGIKNIDISKYKEIEA